MQKSLGKIQILVVLIVVVLIIGAYYLGKNSSFSDGLFSEPPTSVNDATKTSSQEATTDDTLNQISKIAYEKDGDIFVYDLASKTNKKLTDHKYNSDPVLSPDGTKVAYLSIPQSIVDSGRLDTDYTLKYFKNIWIINSDGTNPVQVTNDLKKRSSISWHLTHGDQKELIFEQEGKMAKYSLKNNKVGMMDAAPPFAYARNSGYHAYLSNEKTLNIQPNDGFLKTYNHDKKIVSIDWTYDNQYVLFTSIDESERIGSATLGLKYAIWYSTLGPQKASQITQYEDRLHSPVMSPDNYYMATFQGTGYADAGNIDLGLVILKMNQNLQVEKQIPLESFSGPDFFENDKKFMYPTGNMIWLNDSELVVRLGALMEPQPNPRGIYKLNLENLTAQRLVEL